MMCMFAANLAARHVKHQEIALCQKWNGALEFAYAQVPPHIFYAR